jgi:hypothetical protein
VTAARTPAAQPTAVAGGRRKAAPPGIRPGRLRPRSAAVHPSGKSARRRGRLRADAATSHTCRESRQPGWTPTPSRSRAG